MIQIAIAGPGNISHRFLEGIKYVPDAAVTAFGTRNPNRVKAYAEAHHIAKVDSFSNLCNDSSIAAFYISTPNHVHYEMIKEALSSGKHVLCEKPITVTTAEYRELLGIAHAKQLVLMEAHKTLYTPVFQSISNVLNEHRLGKICSASAGFCRNDPHAPDEWRLHTRGGGALYDVGCYGLAELFGLFGPDLQLKSHSQELVDGLNTGGMISLEKNGIPMNVPYSFVKDGDCDLRIVGTLGTLTCHAFWKSDSYSILCDGQVMNYRFPFASEFTFEIQQFINRINNRQWQDRFSEEISMRILEILDSSLTI